MKKVIAFIGAVIMIMSLCACESPQERANRKIEEANKAYREVQNEYDRLQSELEEIQRKIDQANGN